MEPTLHGRWILATPKKAGATEDMPEMHAPQMPPLVQLRAFDPAPAMRSPLESLLAAQEIVESRENEASKQAETLARAHASAAHAAATAAIAAAADAAAARAAAAAAATAAAADMQTAQLSGASTADAPRKGEPLAPAPAATAALAAPGAAMMLAPLSIPQLMTMASMSSNGSTAPGIPSSVDELDLQVRALLNGYAAQRALLLGGAPTFASTPAATIDKKAKKAGYAPGAHGLRWRAPRGRMARELRGGE